MTEAVGRSSIMLDDSRRPGASEEHTGAAEDGDTSFSHIPVMCDEVIEALAGTPSGPVLDCTLGGAGHALALLDASPDHQVIGIDRDQIALDAASRRLAANADRASVHRARFDQLDDVLDGAGVTSISGFLFDLGVSSPQLDIAGRGFSFRNDGPLDMRMDQSRGQTAADIVNNAEHGELAGILRRNADERFAGRIASAIIANRPIESTAQLAEVVVGGIPAAARRTGGHPAKRTFQALRIEVNDELAILRPALERAIEHLCIDGVGVVLTYHSGEDKIVKDVIRNRTTVEGPRDLPVAPPEPDFEAMRPLARKPSAAELERNPRSASVRMRGIRRVRSERSAA